MICTFKVQSWISDMHLHRTFIMTEIKVFSLFIHYTASCFNSTVLKFHDFSQSTNRDGLNFMLQEMVQ